jgi:protein-tyrosine phosphatase
VFTSILTVCMGNICRSPMAEAALADRLGRRGVAAVIASAGITALVGRSADPIAQELMAGRGLDISGHRARQLTPELIRSFELIVVMEKDQQKAVEAILPSARGRVRCIGHWGGFDVPDPYRQGRPAFELALALIERGLDDFEKAFWSKRP